MNKADKLLEDLREVDLFNVDSVNYGNRKHYIDQLESVVRQQQAEIEALQSTLSGNKEVMADWETEVKALKENNAICWRSQRQLKNENEALKAELHKYKPQIWEVMKEANK